MKLNSQLLLTFLSLVAHTHAAQGGGGAVATCAEQANCFSWTATKQETSLCTLTDATCIVEVCMVIDTGGDCAKNGASISHVCDAADANGCPNQDGTPLFDTGGTYSGSCNGETIGQGTGTLSMAGGKCGDVTNLTLCQQGNPGDTLYWIIKDSNDNTVDTAEMTHSFDVIPDDDPNNNCQAQYTCSNGAYSCGQVNAQLMKERMWGYTIPTSSASCDWGCGPTDETTTASPISAPKPDTQSPVATEEATTASPISAPDTQSPVATEEGTTAPPIAPKPTAGSSGDPHFKTWKNEHFEYHGQCDMVLTKDDAFANGLGMHVQIRTKLVRFWSYIQQAAIRIGDDILEVEGAGDPEAGKTLYWINLEYQGELKTLGGFPVTLKVQDKAKRRFEIDLSSKYPNQKIVISTYKEFVRVDFLNGSEESYGNTVGLLGDFKTGKTFARDGSTVLNDFSDFGNEWQVLPVENMLFHDVSEPQFPKKCIEPEDPRGERRRRLDEAKVTEKQAETACALLKDAADIKDCVYDILATQDLDMVGAF